MIAALTTCRKYVSNVTVHAYKNCALFFYSDIEESGEMQERRDRYMVI